MNKKAKLKSDIQMGDSFDYTIRQYDSNHKLILKKKVKTKTNYPDKESPSGFVDKYYSSDEINKLGTRMMVKSIKDSKTGKDIHEPYDHPSNQHPEDRGYAKFKKK